MIRINGFSDIIKTCHFIKDKYNLSDKEVAKLLEDVKENYQAKGESSNDTISKRNTSIKGGKL